MFILNEKGKRIFRPHLIIGGLLLILAAYFIKFANPTNFVLGAIVGGVAWVYLMTMSFYMVLKRNKYFK